MISSASPVIAALLGTLFTWFLTAVGAAVVYIIPSNLSAANQRKLLDCSLGFAAGVMIAASFWSLLDPALQFAKESKLYGEEGEFAFIPVAIGFGLGSSKQR
jgi:zinc transporter 11